MKNVNLITQTINFLDANGFSIDAFYVITFRRDEVVLQAHWDSELYLLATNVFGNPEVSEMEYVEFRTQIEEAKSKEIINIQIVLT